MSVLRNIFDMSLDPLSQLPPRLGGVIHAGNFVPVYLTPNLILLGSFWRLYKFFKSCVLTQNVDRK